MQEFGMNGAQPVEVFLEAFGKVAPVAVIGDEGDSCGVDGEDC